MKLLEINGMTYHLCYNQYQSLKNLNHQKDYCLFHCQKLGILEVVNTGWHTRMLPLSEGRVVGGDKIVVNDGNR
jgi:hypothetical protein